MARPRIRLLVLLGLAAMAIVVVTTLFIGRSSSAITYLVVDVAALEQGSTAVVRGPNAAGDAVGGGRVAGARRGLLFTRGGVQEISGLSGSDYTTIFGINDVGDAVGSSNTTAAVRAFRTTRAGAIGELPPLPGDTASTAFAVNKGGQAVGFSSGRGGEQAADVILHRIHTQGRTRFSEPLFRGRGFRRERPQRLPGQVCLNRRQILERAQLS